jgi:drug/metabolite transporter (DMT)-like permease
MPTAAAERAGPRQPGVTGSAAGRRTRETRAGFALAILAAATFGTSGIFGSSLIRAGWSPAAAVVTRIAVSAVILTVPAAVQMRGRWALLRANAGVVAAYGLVAVAGCQLFYFNAISRIPVGVALLIEYLAPVLVVCWLWLRHGQRPRRLTVAGAAIALAGLSLVLDVLGSGRIDPVGVIWALLAAIGLAIFFTLSASHGDQLPPVVMAWAGMCVGAVTLGTAGWIHVLPMHAAAVSVDLAGHQVSWILPVLGLSIIASSISYLAGIGAARRLGAKLASFISMAEVLFAILFAWLLLGQLPSGLQFAGGALILAGVIMVRLDELRDDPGPSGEAALRPATRAEPQDRPARWRSPLPPAAPARRSNR